MKKCIAYYEAGKFYYHVRKSQRVDPSLGQVNKSLPFYSTSLISVLIVRHLRLDLRSGPFLSCFK
jgi:hypothetical protein